jgi:hypothetical protein
MEADPLAILCGLVSGRVELYSRFTYTRYRPGNIGYRCSTVEGLLMNGGEKW